MYPVFPVSYPSPQKRKIGLSKLKKSDIQSIDLQSKHNFIILQENLKFIMFFPQLCWNGFRLI